MTAAAFDTRRARLVEYIPWMLRDYASNQGPATLVVVLLVGVTPVMSVMQGPMDIPFGAMPEELARRVLMGLIPVFAFLGPFFATNGIIANDRKFSYYRFSFAKPVSPVAYYVVTFAVYGIGLLAVVLGFIGIWAAAVRPMFPVELFAIMAIMYVAFGGIGFLLSAAWRFDWLSLVAVLFVANVLWSSFGDSTHPLHWLLYLLPPAHRTGDVYAMLASSDAALNWGAILWITGYGVVCFLLGMLVIRKRPLGTS